VTSDFVTRLMAGLDRADVVMARTDRGIEPLCAAFQTEPALAAVRRALLEGRLKMTSAFEGLLVHSLDAEEKAFANINTLGDYDQLGRR
jgi:molybdopterin-guanine dinucleotide biosynthesis protein A